jgi:hypothetical protein
LLPDTFLNRLDTAKLLHQGCESFGYGVLGKHDIIYHRKDYATALDETTNFFDLIL